MAAIFLLFTVMLSVIFSESASDKDIKTIEQFLSSMTTLEADMEMILENGDMLNHFNGKIWLDRRNGFLRINYGKNNMVAKNGMLFVFQENQDVQKFDTADTPAGILMKPSIDFKGKQVNVKDFKKGKECWQLVIAYDTPIGEIPVVLYFRPPPVIILLGWRIQNSDGSNTRVQLDPEKTHMSVNIDPSIFNVRGNS